MNAKFILTRALHLGFIKDTFGAGAVIELDEARGMLIINGRKFNDTRDLDILQRHGWIVPYDEEVLAQYRSPSAPKPVVNKKPRPGENMPIVRSDEDNMPDPIDISSTQVSKRNMEAKEESRRVAKERQANHQMEVIKGDESVEERIASLKNKTDIVSMSERVRLKRERAQMQIVRDDSLGAGVGKSQVTLNAGQHLPSREEADAKKAEAEAAAAARKQQVESTRRNAGIEVAEDKRVLEAIEVDQDIPATGIVEVAVESMGASPLRSENEALKAENEALKAAQSDFMRRLDALENGKKGPGRPRGKVVQKIARTPVAVEA